MGTVYNFRGNFSAVVLAAEVAGSSAERSSDSRFSLVASGRDARAVDLARLESV